MVQRRDEQHAKLLIGNHPWVGWDGVRTNLQDDFTFELFKLGLELEAAVHVEKGSHRLVSGVTN